MKNLVIFSLLLAISFGVAQAQQQQTDTLSIFFDIDKSVVGGNNAKSLDKLIAGKNVTSITIYGYTDFLGSVEYNQELSEKRSENVRNYLINKGINKKNIILSKGEGIHPNSTEENRRDLSDKGIQAHRIVRVQVVYERKKKIYHDNFGRFSDSSNYTDAFGTSRPARNWQTCLPYPVPGHTCRYGEIGHGEYTVCALGHGSLVSWIDKRMNKDASGDPNGGVFLIDVNDNHTPAMAPHYGEIYKHQIDNISPNVNLYFEVSIANASARPSITSNTIPPNITISILTTGGKVLGETNSNLVSNLAFDARGWQKVVMPPFTTNETSVVLKIVCNNTCCWDNGVDLLMDDIILSTD